jgi:iron complex transport system substrate-binding protein
MKACSFLPAVTQMIYDMNLQHKLYGVTFECPSIALQEKARVVRCVLEGKNYTSVEIDRIFSASKAQGKSLYYVDETVLEKILPDVIFTQDVCEVCQIDTACTHAAVSKLAIQPAIIPITPLGLGDVFTSCVTIAAALGEEGRAYTHLALLQSRIDVIVDMLRASRAQTKRVTLMEWMEPIFNCGHWIPDQIAIAGGIDMLSNPRGDSRVILWDKIVQYDPEVIIIAPCGFNAQRTMEEFHLVSTRPGWHDLAAVKNNAVHIVDFDLFTQPSASTLVDGIDVLVALFHPELFELPERLKRKVMSAKSFAPILP